MLVANGGGVRIKRCRPPIALAAVNSGMFRFNKAPLVALVANVAAPQFDRQFREAARQDGILNLFAGKFRCLIGEPPAPSFHTAVFRLSMVNGETGTAIARMKPMSKILQLVNCRLCGRQRRRLVMR